MAVHVLAYNISSIEDMHLDCVPDSYLRETWARLKKIGMSLHAWKLLSKYLLRDPSVKKTMDLYHHKEHVCRPTAPLSLYLNRLSSPTFDFIASLTLTGPCPFTTHELLPLSDLPNLGVLEIIAPTAPRNPVDPPPPFPQISNSLFISWANQDTPFPSLRVLRVWGPGLLTQNVLGHLDKFPALALFDVLGYCGEWAGAEREAENMGWDWGSPISRYWDPVLRYFHLILPTELTNQPESPGGVQFRPKADFVDNELMRYVGRGQNPVAKAPTRPRRLLTDVLESRRGRRQGIFNHHGPAESLPVAQSDGLGCNSPKSTDLWNFWTCCFVGQLCNDQDLKDAYRKHGSRRAPRTLERSDMSYKSLFDDIGEWQVMFENILLTALPFSHLQLGHYARTRDGIHPIWVGEEDTARYTFARRNVHKPRGARGGSVAPTSVVEEHGAGSGRTRGEKRETPTRDFGVRQCKKIRIEDILNNMTC
ncbi:hypothetical protein MKZ38_006715 [Zalerion maritima]|uniref:Uncharacterized protein n=1 Tax=Zalerion maritima TaxID=339359 RepID=A0AAD5RIQ9_9PEZI|nr:hypothetical protein MKZ38_006715 [Zalerion maritima]